MLDFFWCCLLNCKGSDFQHIRQLFWGQNGERQPFDAGMNSCMGYTPTQKAMKAVSERCRMMANNINKSASAKTLQPERETDFKLPIKPLDYPIRALRVCKRATVESRKGHSCIAAVALLQACWGSFRPVFGIGTMLIKFKWLIASALKASPKFAYLRRVDCRLQISQSQGAKVSK